MILDIVTNHMGQLFYYDINLNGQPDDQHRRKRRCERRLAVAGHAHHRVRSRLGSARRPGVHVARRSPGRAPIIFIQDPAINRVPPSPAFSAPREAYHGFGPHPATTTIREQRLLGDFPGGLKDVATELPEVRDAMVDAYARWVELADLDGFRIDTVKHVEHEFWQLVHRRASAQRLAAKGKNELLHVRRGLRRQRRAPRQLHAKPAMLDRVFYFSQHFQVFRDVFRTRTTRRSRRAPTRSRALGRSAR